MQGTNQTPPHAYVNPLYRGKEEKAEEKNQQPEESKLNTIVPGKEARMGLVPKYKSTTPSGSKTQRKTERDPQPVDLKPLIPENPKGGGLTKIKPPMFSKKMPNVPISDLMKSPRKEGPLTSRRPVMRKKESEEPSSIVNRDDESSSQGRIKNIELSFAEIVTLANQTEELATNVPEHANNEPNELNILAGAFDQETTTFPLHDKESDVNDEAENISDSEKSAKLELKQLTAPHDETNQSPDSLSASAPRQSFFTRPSSVRGESTARVGSLRNSESVKQKKEEQQAIARKKKRDAFKSTKATAFVTKTNAPSIREKLPTGMILDIHGNISGKHQFTKYPANTVKYSDVPLEEVVREGQGKLLLDAISLGGVRVVEFARRDFHRMTYEIPTKDGNFNPLPWPSDIQIADRAAQDTGSNEPTKAELKSAKETLRQEQIARALRNFSQDDDESGEANDNVALVLSSVMTQHIGDLLQQVVYPNKPFVAVSLSTARDNDGKDRPLTIRNSLNQEQPVVVKGLGGDATFALARDGKNFKMTLDYTTYVEARRGRENEFPLHPDGVVRIRLRTEILVVGNQARNGVLAVTMPEGIQAEYAGRLILS